MLFTQVQFLSSFGKSSDTTHPSSLEIPEWTQQRPTEHMLIAQRHLFKSHRKTGAILVESLKHQNIP
eukprot:01771_6